MTNITIDNVDLKKLETLTSYPSIPTYHQRSERGKLSDEIRTPFTDTGEVYVTEKIDGANARLIVLPDGSWVAASRQHLLATGGQRIYNDADKIVTGMSRYANTIVEWVCDNYDSDLIITVYAECYGQVQKYRDYGDGSLTGIRAFDIAAAPVEIFAECDRAQIAAWRDNPDEGPIWASVASANTNTTWHNLTMFASDTDIPTVPSLGVIDNAELPTTVEDTAAWLDNVLPHTQASLIPGANGRGEGVVIRSNTRQTIAKIRVEDYAKTLRSRPKK